MKRNICCKIIKSQSSVKTQLEDDEKENLSIKSKQGSRQDLHTKKIAVKK